MVSGLILSLIIFQSFFIIFWARPLPHSGCGSGYPLRQGLSRPAMTGGCGGFRWSPPRSRHSTALAAPCLRSYPSRWIVASATCSHDYHHGLFCVVLTD